ncbi:hypothetical protein EBR04_10300, partial [bacterium]|nr:hypothetical protein [bacterium]
LTLPDDFTASVARCRGMNGGFEFDRWASDGMPQLTPLWLLKYLPNMPASHIAIYNDLRGPSNSLTVREASGHLAVGEATVTIQRGAADIMVAGATGTRVHPMKTVHALQTEQVAHGDGDPTRWSRPFDAHRSGMVLGEGAAVLILEELSHAERRGARIHGEVVGHAARSATDPGGAGRRRQALAHAIGHAVEMAGDEGDLGSGGERDGHRRTGRDSFGDDGRDVDLVADAVGAVGGRRFEPQHGRGGGVDHDAGESPAREGGRGEVARDVAEPRGIHADDGQLGGVLPGGDCVDAGELPAPIGCRERDRSAGVKCDGERGACPDGLIHGGGDLDLAANAIGAGRRPG